MPYTHVMVHWRQSTGEKKRREPDANSARGGRVLCRGKKEEEKGATMICLVSYRMNGEMRSTKDKENKEGGQWLLLLSSATKKKKKEKEGKERTLENTPDLIGERACAPGRGRGEKKREEPQRRFSPIFTFI